jgi:hypothetical protein
MARRMRGIVGRVVECLVKSCCAIAFLCDIRKRGILLAVVVGDFGGMLLLFI